MASRLQHDVAIVDVMLRKGPCHAIVEGFVADGVPFVVHYGDVAAAHGNTVFAKGHWLGKPAITEELIAVLGEMLTKRQIS